jgi:hypothetical protein
LAGAGDVLAVAPRGLDRRVFVERLVLKRTHITTPNARRALTLSRPVGFRQLSLFGQP